MKRLAMAVLVSSVVGLSGCATIVGSSDQPFQVTSQPEGADFKIKDENGKVVSTGKTPQTVTLPKSDGTYFGGKDYTVTFSKDGMTSESTTSKSHANGWYIAGNILFGGLIGWLAVDPFNGGMWSYGEGAKPTAVLVPNKAGN